MLLVHISQWFRRPTQPLYAMASVSVRPLAPERGTFLLDFEKGDVRQPTVLEVRLTRHDLQTLRDEIQWALKEGAAWDQAPPSVDNAPHRHGARP